MSTFEVDTSEASPNFLRTAPRAISLLLNSIAHSPSRPNGRPDPGIRRPTEYLRIAQFALFGPRRRGAETLKPCPMRPAAWQQYKALRLRCGPSRRSTIAPATHMRQSDEWAPAAPG